MTQENINVLEAKRSLKELIEFAEGLLRNLRSGNRELHAKSMFAAWCLDRYVNEQLLNDIQQAAKANMNH